MSKLTFTEDAVDTLQSVLDDHRAKSPPPKRQRRQRRGGTSSPPGFVGKTDAPIDARSGATMNSGTVSRYENNDGTLEDTEQNVEAVYNPLNVDIPGSSYVWVERGRDGSWYCSPLDC